MLRLRTFGSVGVSSDEVSLDAAAGQRRVLALLAILAIVGERGITRDAVLALLWPEGDPERSRQALTQALYHTRRALRSEELISRNGDLKLNRSLITSDVGDFEGALAAGDLDRAAALYQGPFLDGFFISGAPEFERWAAAQRDRLASLCIGALERLSVAAESAGDPRRATQWRKRLAALDPLNSRYAIALVTAMAAAGDRAGALQHARIHASMLRAELDLAPDPALTALVDRLREPVPSPVTAAADHAAIGSQRTSTAIVALAADEAASAPIVPHGDQPAHVLMGEMASGRRADPHVLRSRIRRRALAIGGTLTVVAAAVALAAWPRRDDVPVVPGRVVVAPFRVSGADPSLAYLREGLVDLLTTTLGDENAATTVDPASVVGAWRRAGFADIADVPRATALSLASRLGAGRLLTGGVVGNASRVVISASVMAVPTGEMRAQATVAGSADSLNALVDLLAARLLVAESGERDRLSRHTTTSLRALRAYIDGQAALRRGRFTEAIRLFRTALERDSSFAMAGLSLAQAAERAGAEDQRVRGLAFAWDGRAGLTERDRLLLDALAGPHYPSVSNARELLTAWERAVAALPDRADVWQGLGEHLYRSGALLELPDARERAVVAFTRARSLDPDFGPAIQFSLQTAAADGDSGRVRAMAHEYFRVDSAADLAEFVRWRVAVALHDTVQQRAVERRGAAITLASARQIALSSIENGIGTRSAERTLIARLRQTVRTLDRADLLRARHALAMNRGHPLDARAALMELQALRRSSSGTLALVMLDALYGDGDKEAARDAAGRVGAMRAFDPQQADDRCALEQWRLANGDTRTAQATIAWLRRDDGTPSADLVSRDLCAALLDAQLAMAERRPDIATRLGRLDSLVLSGPAANTMMHYLPIALSRLHERAGDRAHALTAIRRRPLGRPWPAYLANALREEGRLAAESGDIAGARRAWRHYLALRQDPAPELSSDVAVVRAAVERMKDQSGGS